MIQLTTFLQSCEEDLIKSKKLSAQSVALIESLSNRDKALCAPIFPFVDKSISIDYFNEPENTNYSSEEKIAVCRLIPLPFYLNTPSPAWSSYMLTLGIQAALSIPEIKFSEIAAAFLDTSCKFNVPLNNDTKEFCHRFAIELMFQGKKIAGSEELFCEEFNRIWHIENAAYQNNSTVVFFRYLVSGEPTPHFLVETAIGLVYSECWASFVEDARGFIENKLYKEEFRKYLLTKNLTDSDRKLVLQLIAD